MVSASAPKLCCSVPISGGRIAPPIAKVHMMPEARFVCSPKSSEARLKMLPHMMELKKPQSNIRMMDTSLFINKEMMRKSIAMPAQNTIAVRTFIFRNIMEPNKRPTISPPQ